MCERLLGRTAGVRQHRAKAQRPWNRVPLHVLAIYFELVRVEPELPGYR